MESSSAGGERAKRRTRSGRAVVADDESQEGPGDAAIGA